MSIMTLKNVKIVGKFRNASTGKIVTMKIGENPKNDQDRKMYYISKGKRVFVSPEEYASNDWLIVH